MYGVKIEENAEVSRKETQQVLNMRKAARIYAKIRHMQDMFQDDGARGFSSRCNKIKLVGE
jgi:hypothetical protein